MAISGLKTWVTGDALTATNLNADKAVLEAKFGAINSADLSASAGIANTQLANAHYEMCVNMTVDGIRWAAAANGDIIAMAGIGNDVNTESYSIVGVDYGVFDSTGLVVNTDTFDIEWGYFNAVTGAWTVDTQINTGGALAMPVPAGAGATSGSWQTLAAVATHVHLSTSTPMVFGLQRVANVGAGFTTADQILTVCIKLKRTDGLRS